MINTFIYNKNKNSTSIIEILKWIGLVSMTIDHVGTVFFEHILFLRYIGRYAFIIFGFVLIYNFIYNSRNKKEYIKRIFIFALISEPIHIIVFKSTLGGLSIFFTYVYVLTFIYIYEKVLKDPTKKKLLFLVLVFILLIFNSTYTEYGITGFLLINSFYFWIKYKIKLEYFLLFFLLFLTLLYIPNVYFIFSSLSLIPLFLIIIKYFTLKIPRFPFFFYLYYPVHLLIIWLYAYHW